MKVTELTRSALAYRREIRDMEKDGWEMVNESGGRLWELTRGGRWQHQITDVRICVDGKTLWIKTEKRP